MAIHKKGVFEDDIFQDKALFGARVFIVDINKLNRGKQLNPHRLLEANAQKLLYLLPHTLVDLHLPEPSLLRQTQEQLRQGFAAVQRLAVFELLPPDYH